jgi:TfoX/Sxy family transcriptional regulator of competence genes
VTAERAWSLIVDRCVDQPHVTAGTMFRSEGLRFGDKYFAMLCRGELVVKLDAVRVDELETAGIGSRFDPGHGRKMREWLSVPLDHRRRWRTLVTEALGKAERHGKGPRPSG